MQQGSNASNGGASAPAFGIGFAEFVMLIAMLMALNALSIDPMLPALPAIGDALKIADENSRQWIITAYFLGMGVGSLFYGSLADRWGRKPVILISLALYFVATLFCALASSFTMMIVARTAAGFFAAAIRVVAISVVRDRFSGDRMASVMSTIFIVFLIVPVLAPTFGQLVLYVASWRWIFGALLVGAVLVMAWTAVRLPETLRREHRIAINLGDVSATFLEIAAHRNAIGYMLATGMVMSALMGFVNSVQQIFFDVFDAAAIFPYAFAGIAGCMAIGSFGNSRLVEKLGARRLSQGSLIAMIAMGGLHSLVIWLGWETLGSFIVLQALTMICFSLTGSNFGSISMEPFARGAGAASSFQACLTTIVSAIGGALVGQMFNGTPLPLTLGFMLCGIFALALVFWAERGRLFTRSVPQLD